MAPQAEVPENKLVEEFEDKGGPGERGGARTVFGRGGFGNMGGFGRHWRVV